MVKVREVHEVSVCVGEHSPHLLIGRAGIGFGVKMDGVVESVGEWRTKFDVVEKFLGMGAGFKFDAYLVGAVVVNDGVGREVVRRLHAKGSEHQRGGEGVGALRHEGGAAEPDKDLVRDNLAPKVWLNKSGSMLNKT